MNFELDKDDIQKLESTFSISESILETYKLLANLEIEGKYNTPEYFKAMECLNSSRNLEKSLLENIIKDKKKSFGALNYIENKYKVNPATPFDTTLFNMSDNERTKIRVARKIRDVLAENEDDVMSIIPKEVRIFLEENIPEEETKSEIKDIRTVIKSINTLDTDNISFILNKLESKINSPFYKKIKNELIKIKYLIIYMNEENSNLLKENTLQMPNELFFTGDFVMAFNNMHNNFLKLLREYFAFSESLKQIEKMLIITDINYQDINKQIELELREIILRLTLQYMKPQDLEITNEAVHEIIDRPEFEGAISAKTIIGAYKSYNKDKASIRKISFKMN